MSWLDRLHPQRRRLDGLLSAHRFREALEFAAELEGDLRDPIDEEICQTAATHWLSEAEAACYDGDRNRMNAAMGEAARFHRASLGSLFREARWRIRQYTLELTMPTHWTVLLGAAAAQRVDFLAGVEPDNWAVFANPSLHALIDREHPGGADALDGLDAEALERLRPALGTAYPASLRPYLAEARVEFVRAACWVAMGRPDLAVLPLLELDDTAPLVCLERARVAYSLGFPATTRLALADFEAHHGNHVTVRRLNTGVFMAQMAQQSGDLQQAASILARLPLAEVGRRPNLLYAELLAQTGRREQATTALETWLEGYPDDEEAREKLAALTGPDES